MNRYDVLIIGAGVSGCFCALNLDQKLKVALIDVNQCILKKFMMCGKGKANIANTQEPKDFLKNLIDANKFLYPSISRYNGQSILNFLNQHNLKFYYKEPHRVHLEDSNEQFRKLILNQLKQKNVEIILNSLVEQITSNNSCFVINTSKQTFRCKKLIMATGGRSFVQIDNKYTGYQLMESFNHRINPQYPIGVGLHIEDNHFANLQGVKLDNVTIEVYWDNKLKYRETGSLMFTHYGIGGPVVRRVSGYVSKYLLDHKSCKIKVSFIDETLITNSIKNSHYFKDLFKTYHGDVLKLLTGITNNDWDFKNACKQDIKKFIDACSNVWFDINQTEPLEVATNTGGGVSIKEIDPNTLESTLVPGLFCIGELLDINPRTNGYNITTCYATANACANKINDDYAD